MQRNGDSKLYGYEGGGKEILIHVGKALLIAGDLGGCITQCQYTDCETFWFWKGEWAVREMVPPGPFKILKKVILILNRVVATPEQIRSTKGLGDVSHGLCRLCIREKRLDTFLKHQERRNFDRCFGTKKAGETCDREIYIQDRKWDCSHPCTIHPERESLRRKRMELLKIHYGGRIN